jgi:asparagine synthase (glutamine-hydrolysing)
MCGIFGCTPVNKEWLNRALRIHHPRGPDHAATFETKWENMDDVGIAVNRLAITGADPKNAQPVCSQSLSSTCILNGAIYNYSEIMRKFKINKTLDNDAALIVELYERIGVEFVNYIRGMYAFILIDLSLQKLIVARDPLGLKPLYWAKGDGEYVVFSNSLNAIPDELAPTAHAFPPGVLWIKLKEEEYKLNITPRGVTGQDPELVLINSIAAHIPTDVKWGCSLSGGVDSSLICALAKSISLDFPCYSLFLDIPEQLMGGTLWRSSDFIASKFVTKYLDVELRPVVVTRQDVVQAIPKLVQVIGSFEEGMILGGLGAYFVAKAARDDGCKVLLTGMGADEMFGGYPRYARVPLSSLNDRLVIDQMKLATKHCSFLDHASMAAGIEARTPYIDNEVLASSRLLPLNKKVDASHAWRTKIFLREFAAKYLPKEIYGRNKIAMGRGSGMQILFKDAINDFDKSNVSASEMRSFKLKDDVEVSLFSVWKKNFGHFSTGREDIYERALGTREV